MPEVVWLRSARQDLDDIAAYIADENPKAAERVVRGITESVSSLAFHPLIGSIGRVEGTRELVIADYPYIVAYRAGARVEILAIYHAARKWPQTF